MPYAASTSEKSSSLSSVEFWSAEKSPKEKHWETISFSSTLYLRPVLDALLVSTPTLVQDELRLGLQEALVNAAKHGNRLDPQKVVSVRYAHARGCYWWVVTDEGDGFDQPITCPCPSPDAYSVSECGRGLFILHQVFDQVRWSNDGKEICLVKQVRSGHRLNLMTPAFFVRMVEAWWRRWSSVSSSSVPGA